MSFLAMENQTSCIVNGDDSLSAISKISKAFLSCQSSIQEYSKLRLIFDCIHELTSTSANNGLLDENTVTKLKEILRAHELKKYLQLQTTDKCVTKELSLLGILELEEMSLSHVERQKLKVVVENMLRQKMTNFISGYETLGGNIEEILKSHDLIAPFDFSNCHTMNLINWNLKTKEICEKYKQELLNCVNLVGEWRRIKYNDMKRLNLRDAENLLQESEVAEAQIKIVERSSAIKMFEETPTTLDAFKILSNDLDNKIIIVQKKLNERKALKKMYEDVLNGEYQQVLNKYREHCEEIKKKKQLIKMMETG